MLEGISCLFTQVCVGTINQSIEQSKNSLSRIVSSISSLGGNTDEEIEEDAPTQTFKPDEEEVTHLDETVEEDLIPSERPAEEDDAQVRLL